MRGEREMLGLIREVAAGDERVRAVIMNGSRVNPNAPRDIFQDYDIVYVVSLLEPLLADRSWLQRFGDLIIMQTPDEMGMPESPGGPGFAFLMLLSDGNRIDLTLHPVDALGALGADSLTRVLLDKDRLFPPLPPPSDADYLSPAPSAKDYADCCNEFWWVSTYVAKGLWRRELPYAKFHLDRPVRDMLDQMLRWYIDVRSGHHVSAGKCGKYFDRLLEPALWTRYVATYAGADDADVWRALLAAGDLFREVATAVARHFGYDYPRGDDQRVTAYLGRVRSLPPDAPGIF